jgi:putative transcriptional regulator
VSPLDGASIRTLRQRLCLSQAGFATRYQLQVRTVQNWEQDRDGITGSALTLLILIDREPELVAEILARGRARI